MLRPAELAATQPVAASPAITIPTTPLAQVPARTAAAGPPVLGTADIVATPKSRKRRAAAAAPKSAAKPAPKATPAAAASPTSAPKGPQRYAVQVIWSKEPIDLTKIPSLAIFGGYLLYAVETEPGGRRMFGVRLGFYDDILSARLVALYLRPTFKGVVVPVSEREVASATGASIRLSGSPGIRGRITPQAMWPRTAVPVPAASAHQMASGSP